MRTIRKPVRVNSATTVAGVRALFFFALATALEARAHWSCVSTSAELQQALTDASDGGIYNAEDNIIAVMQGTYATGAATNQGSFHYHSVAPHYLQVQGGYIANCTTLTNVASLSVLDGGNLTAVLALRSRKGDIFVQDLTLQNGESVEPGAGLQVNYQATDNTQVSIEDTIIRDNHTSASAGGFYVFSSSNNLHNNLITGNSADGQFGAGYISNHGIATTVTQNTVTYNTTSFHLSGHPPIGGLFCGGDGVCYVENNIIWHNTNHGLYLGAPGAVLEHNDIGSQGGFAPDPASSFDNLSVLPGFVDPLHGDFHLTGNSPLLNFAPAIPFTGVDLDGNVYAFLIVDLGAYQRMP